MHDLLRQLGARFFMPGELGEVVPKKATLAVAAQNATVRPDFALRDWNWYNFAGFSFDDVIWARRIGMNSLPRGARSAQRAARTWRCWPRRR